MAKECAMPRPVRDIILVELEMPPALRRAVGTQHGSYFVPNGTRVRRNGFFYQ